METQDDNILLKKYFDSIKEEKYKESFNDVEDWLRREVELSYNKPEKSGYSFVKFFFSEGRLKFAYLFIILILVGITSNFSVTRTEPVGVVMSWSVDKQNPESIKKIDNFDWVDKTKLIVNEENTDGKQVLTYKMLLPSATPQEIERLKSELANIKDVYSVNVIPISEPVKQPLYAVALGKVFDFDYGKNYANPEEIRNIVYEQLKIAGIQNDVNLSVIPISSAGKYVNFDFGKKPDSIRIKIHSDIVNEYDLEEALDEIDEIWKPVQLISDSILKKVFVRINGENVCPDVVMYEVQKNLDTLHIKLKNSETKRKERMEKLNEKMEKFQEKMDRFNRNMEKFSRKMERLNEKMSELKIPDIEFNYEVNEDGDIDIDIDVDLDEVPEIQDKSFNFNFNTDEFNKNFKINIDTLNFRLDMEKMNNDIKENMENVKEEMKKYKEDMKKYKEDMKKNKMYLDSSKVKIYYDDDDDVIELDDDDDNGNFENDDD